MGSPVSGPGPRGPVCVVSATKSRVCAPLPTGHAPLNPSLTRGPTAPGPLARRTASRETGSGFAPGEATPSWLHRKKRGGRLSSPPLPACAWLHPPPPQAFPPPHRIPQSAPRTMLATDMAEPVGVAIMPPPAIEVVYEPEDDVVESWTVMVRVGPAPAPGPALAASPRPRPRLRVSHCPHPQTPPLAPLATSSPPAPRRHVVPARVPSTKASLTGRSSRSASEVAGFAGTPPQGRPTGFSGAPFHPPRTETGDSRSRAYER